MDNKSRVFGVDVSKAWLIIGDYERAVPLKIDNTPMALARWLSSIARGSIVAMEATGVYHQGLAAMAHAAGMRVFVLNPRALKHYAQAIGQRGKTDPIDTRMIARYAMHEQAKTGGHGQACATAATSRTPGSRPAAARAKPGWRQCPKSGARRIARES
jgi:transposase